MIMPMALGFDNRVLLMQKNIVQGIKTVFGVLVTRVQEIDAKDILIAH